MRETLVGGGIVASKLMKRMWEYFVEGVFILHMGVTSVLNGFVGSVPTLRKTYFWTGDLDKIMQNRYNRNGYTGFWSILALWICGYNAEVKQFVTGIFGRSKRNNY